ncbi:hypothetical protein BC829DRAFT_409531 [Chytridium lagenaria]|nr:hypothetical protein BC829DRAFT_409531 [Chytridium lagenaria]
MNLEEWVPSKPHICCICLEADDEQDPVIYCSRLQCAVMVHQDCYGVKVPKEQRMDWLCDPCTTGDPDIARCALCPNRDGALRLANTKDSLYVHIVCALWIKEVAVNIGRKTDQRSMSNIDIRNIDPKKWKGSCSICPDDIDSQRGCKVPCDAHGCKNSDVDNDEMGDPFFVFCKQHAPDDEPYLNRWASWVRKKNSMMTAASALPQIEPRSIRQAVIDSLLVAKERQEELLYGLQEGACRNNSDTSFRHQLLPKMEKGISTTGADIKSVENEAKAIETRGKIVREQFRALIFKLFDVALPEDMDLSTLAETLRNCSGREAQTAGMQKLKEIYRNLAERFLDDTIPTAAPQSEILGLRKKKRKKVDKASLKCAECKAGSNGVCDLDKEVEQDRLNWIVCDGCLKAFHWGCLDPPVTKPKRRGYEWRCEECDEYCSGEALENEKKEAAEKLRRSKRRRSALTKE